MRKQNLLISILILLNIISCNSKGQNKIPPYHEKNICKYISLKDSDFYSSDTSFYSNFFQLLESSDLVGAKTTLLNHGFVESHIYGGYYILIPSKTIASSFNYYLSFRFSEAQGEVDKNNLRLLLIDSYRKIKEDSSDYSKCLIDALELESKNLKVYDNFNDKLNLNYLKELKEEYMKNTQYSRAQFLWAIASHNAGNYSESLPLFFELLQKKRYERKVFTILYHYYDEVNINKDSAIYFSELLRVKYPGNCDLEKLNQLIKSKNESRFMMEYAKCVGSGRTNDSIESKVLLSYFYLETLDLKKSEQLCLSYYQNDSNFSFSPKQSWERQKYFDISAKILFIRGNYLGLSRFIFKKSGNGEIIPLEAEPDFKEYVRYLYGACMKNDIGGINFDPFYNKYFKVFWDKR